VFNDVTDLCMLHKVDSLRVAYFYESVINIS
jgi:hypothetical protein